MLAYLYDVKPLDKFQSTTSACLKKMLEILKKLREEKYSVPEIGKKGPHVEREGIRNFPFSLSFSLHYPKIKPYIYHISKYISVQSNIFFLKNISNYPNHYTPKHLPKQNQAYTSFSCTFLQNTFLDTLLPK